RGVLKAVEVPVVLVDPIAAIPEQARQERTNGPALVVPAVRPVIAAMAIVEALRRIQRAAQLVPCRVVPVVVAMPAAAKGPIPVMAAMMVGVPVVTAAVVVVAMIAVMIAIMVAVTVTIMIAMAVPAAIEVAVAAAPAAGVV